MILKYINQHRFSNDPFSLLLEKATIDIDLSKLQKFDDWHIICSRFELSEEIIDQYIDWIQGHFYGFTDNQDDHLIEYLIMNHYSRFEKRVDWHSISSNLSFSKEFFIKFLDKLHIEKIIYYNDNIDLELKAYIRMFI